MNEPIDTPLQVVHPSALEAASRAEVDVQIRTAKTYPRDLPLVRREILSLATIDIETAESCYYSVPRGGKSIEGPSIRLAELAISSYGNMRAGTRIIATVTTGDNPHVIVQGVCFDLEKNNCVSMEKTRPIYKKNNADKISDDDINLAVNACSAIALRDAVYKVVPRVIINPIWEQCRLLAVGGVETLPDRRAKAITKFQKMGITEAQVLAAVGKESVNDINLEALGTLIGLYTGIKEGHVKIDEAFPPVQAVGKKPEFKPIAGKETKSAEGAAAAPTATTTPTKEPAKSKTAKPAAQAAATTTPPAPPPAQAELKIAQGEDVTVPPVATPDPVKQPETPPAAKAPAAPLQAAAETAPTGDGKSLHEQLREVLVDRKVPEAFFMQWLDETGRVPGATGRPIEDLPEDYIAKIAADGRALSKCVTRYESQ